MKPGALLIALGRDKGDSKAAEDDSSSSDAGYEDDLATALGELADAMGVTLKDKSKAVEAFRTACDLCDRMSGEA